MIHVVVTVWILEPSDQIHTHDNTGRVRAQPGRDSGFGVELDQVEVVEGHLLRELVAVVPSRHGYSAGPSSVSTGALLGNDVLFRCMDPDQEESLVLRVGGDALLAVSNEVTVGKMERSSRGP
jgi:hypothetical protein